MPSPTLNDLLADVDAARDELIALTQALVRVPTVNTGVMPTGDETPACEVLRAKLGEAKIAAEIVESAPGRGSLIARWSATGKAPTPSLMLMGHLDVVPVEDAEQWRHPPFSATLADGRVWGRGASDMKGIVAAEAMALILLKRRGVKPRGDLVLAAGADEETGGAYGFGWLAANRPELIRADYAVNEGGGRPLKRNGVLIYPIDVGEKGRLEVTIVVSGRGYHASAPWMADNAIYGARPVLDRIAAYRPEVSADAEMFTSIGPALGLDEPVVTANVDRVVAELSERDVQLGSWLRAASRMTIVATMIRAGVKSNSIAESCRITCDVRTLPWQDESYVARELDKLLTGLDNVRYEITTTAAPSASSYQSPFADRIAAATRLALKRYDAEFFPGLTTGFTDSRLVRPLGATAYGFAPAHPDSDPSKDGAHNIDESVAVDDLLVMCRVFTALAWETVVA